MENERLLLREDLGEQRGEFFGHVAFRNQDLAFLQPDAPGSKVDFGEAYEDEAKNRSVRTATRVFLGLELGIVCKLCLLGSVPNSFLKRGVVGVFFGCSDPVHASGGIVFQIVSAANENEVVIAVRGSVYAKRFGFNIGAVRT